MAGEGGVTEQDVRAAEAAVERAGGRILQAAAELSHLELPREGEAAAGARLAAELGLEGEEAARLSQAMEAGHGEAQLVLDERRGHVLTSRQVSYRIWRDKLSGQVLVAYGTCTAQLDVEGAAQEGPPADHCVEREGRTFAALPWRPPGDRTDGLDMIKERDDNWIDIPAGWRPYEVCADFASMVRPKVIAAHPWGTDVLLVRKGAHWPALRTAMRDELGGHYSAGNRYCSHVDWFEVSKDGKKCVFRGEEPSFTPSKKLEPVFRPWSGRVLIERVPLSRLLEEWKKYLEVKAKAEWWAALGLA